MQQKRAIWKIYLEMFGLEKKGWKAVDSYFIFKYKVEGDKLLVWVMDGAGQPHE